MKRAFAIGTRVRPTRYAISQFPYLMGKHGVVVGFSVYGRRIKWNYRKSADSYAPIFFDYERHRDHK